MDALVEPKQKKESSTLYTKEQQELKEETWGEKFNRMMQGVTENLNDQVTKEEE